MDAKEYLDADPVIIGETETGFEWTTHDDRELRIAIEEKMESYHKAKSKEEAEERYKKAMAELLTPGWALRPGFIIRIASGKEEQ